MSRKGIFIVSVARATSTTLFKIITQVVEQHRDLYPTAATLLEPFSQSYYVSNNFMDCPGLCIQDGLPMTFDGALERVLSFKNEFVVAKDLAYQMANILLPEYDTALNDLLEMFDFLFLMRHPASTIPSGFHPYFEDGNPSGYKSVEAGFLELYALFQRIQSKTGRAPFVIEAEDYLCEPHETFKKYFPLFHLTYQPSYITWEPLERGDPGSLDFQLWNDTWYHVFRTSGLRIEAKLDSNADVEQQMCKYPNSVANNEYLKMLYATHLPAYLAMKKQGLHG